MEGKEETVVGVTVKGEEAPESYRVAPRTESPRQLEGPTAAAPPPVAAQESSEAKKKRGRPRKYGPDGVALSPMPISSSVPLWQRNKEKIKKKHKLQFGSTGENPALFVGGNFVPHVITVNPGEDVSMKVMSFSQQGSRAICVLSANGSISNVTLRSPTSCGGTLTYEGRFEILSLSGSFTPTESAGSMSRSGGMSVSLAGPDGRVLGGGLGGLLIAAGPVQFVSWNINLGSSVPLGQYYLFQISPLEKSTDRLPGWSRMFHQPPLIMERIWLELRMWGSQ